MTLQRIYDWARTQPGKPALIFNDMAVSYADFARLIERTAAMLSAHGLPRGGTAAVLIDNLADGWVMLMALRRLGLTTISAIAYDRLASLRVPDLSAIVTTSAEAPRHAIPDTLFPGVPRFVVTAEITHIAGMPIPPPLAGAPPGGHVIYTSGTTSRFKQVLVDGPAEAASVTRVAALAGITPATLHHGIDLGVRTAGGYRVPLAVWHQGGTVLFDQRPDRFQRFFSHPVTQAYLPAEWVRALVEAHPRATPRPGFRLVFTSGFLSPALAAEVAARFFSARIAVTYAATEFSARPMSSIVTGPEDLHWLIPSPGRVIEIVDGREHLCPPGVEGALRVRHEAGDATSYLGDPEASASAFRDGCFYPGDQAVARADGRIRILGRLSDMLNLDGRKVPATLPEQELQRKLGLEGTEICLFSGLAYDGEEELVVAVETNGRADLDAIAEAARELLRRSRVRVVRLAEFPRTETRKIRRAALREAVF